MIDNDRREELRESLDKETNDPETQGWREELEYVSQLDEQYITGVAALCTAILVRERIRQRFRPQEIREIETIYDHCRLRMRDGRLLLARLAQDGTLRLDEIDGVC